MNTLRINLHIRSDISPLLYKALIDLPGKPRAEYLRNLAEKGLQGGNFSANAKLIDSGTEDTDFSNNTDDHFAGDLVKLMGSDKKEDKG